jgi:hypothetical protein
MNAALFLSILTAEGKPPTFDPFPGAVQPFAAVVVVILVVLLVWWLLRLQVAQVEPVQVGHGHGDGEGHGDFTHAAAAGDGEGLQKLKDELSAGRA